LRTFENKKREPKQRSDSTEESKTKHLTSKGMTVMHSSYLKWVVTCRGALRKFLITQFHTASRRVVPISSRRERSHLVTHVPLNIT